MNLGGYYAKWNDPDTEGQILHYHLRDEYKTVKLIEAEWNGGFQEVVVGKMGSY